MYKILLSVLVLFAISCKHEPFKYVGPPIDNPGDTTVNPPTGKPCDPDTVYFQNDILPLIVGNCGISGCHDAATAQDGVILDNYANIIQTGDVKPGNPGNSELYENIVETDPDKIMPPPPNSPLTAAEIALIKKWIEQGALNNYCDGGCDTTAVKFSSHVLPIIQQSCKGCHGATPASGALTSLTTHAQIVTGVTSNNLLERIKHIAGFPPMPDNPNPTLVKLDDCKIRTIEIWIDLGMKND